MRTARELLLAYTSLGPEEAGALFAEDGTLELPYLVEIGVESKYEGPENIVKVLGFVHNQLYPGFAFENVKIHLDTPEQVYAEYQINARSAISGKEIHQQFTRGA